MDQSRLIFFYFVAKFYHLISELVFQM